MSMQVQFSSTLYTKDNFKATPDTAQHKPFMPLFKTLNHEAFSEFEIARPVEEVLKTRLWSSQLRKQAAGLADVVVGLTEPAVDEPIV